MAQKPIFCAGITPAMKYAVERLNQSGIILQHQPGWDTGHLLLDVPSFRPGLWTENSLDTLLSSLPKDVTVWGGNLNHPSLHGLRTMDILKDETYLLENAAITADCTLLIVNPLLKKPWSEMNILIIGWGRIGKCLVKLLNSMGCRLTVAARSESDRKSLHSLGYNAVDPKILPEILYSFSLIINTVPAPVLMEQDFQGGGECLKIDLASKRGIAGSDVVWARGLPGIHAPQRSGYLIADTFLRLIKEVSP